MRRSQEFNIFRRDQTNLRLEKIHCIVALGLLPVQLHALVDALLESLHHAVSEDEGDHDGDELYEKEAAKTKRILKRENRFILDQISSAFSCELSQEFHVQV